MHEHVAGRAVRAGIGRDRRAVDDFTKTAGRPLKFLRQTGYAGRIYPINPGRETVLGERAWPSLEALPEAPDHAYIVTPTDAAIEAVARMRQARRQGGDGAGRRLHRGRRVGRRCGWRGCATSAPRTGIRVVGPSSLGIVDLRTPRDAHRQRRLRRAGPAGRPIFAASHSGSMIGSLLSRGKARGIGFAGLVSVGNEVDLSLGEICEATAR